jgi:hypothetical protein
VDTFRVGIDGPKVTLRLVNIKGHDLPLEFLAPSPFYARLLHDQLMQEMGDMFRCIRANAYRQGLKDGRAKRGAEDWFSSQFGVR